MRRSANSSPVWQEECQSLGSSDDFVCQSSGRESDLVRVEGCPGCGLLVRFVRVMCSGCRCRCAFG